MTDEQIKEMVKDIVSNDWKITCHLVSPTYDEYWKKMIEVTRNHLDSILCEEYQRGFQDGEYSND